MRAILIPLAALALALPPAAAQEAEVTDQPERVLATELQTRAEAAGEVHALFTAVRNDRSVLVEDAAAEAEEYSPPEFLVDMVSDTDAVLLLLAMTSLSLFETDASDYAQPLIDEAMAAAGDTRSTSVALAQVMFAASLAELGRDAEARTVLGPTRDFLLVPPQDVDQGEIARVWGFAGFAWLETGDISLAREAFARSRFSAPDDTYSLWVQMGWVSEMARAGYRSEAYQMLQSLLSSLDGNSAAMFDLMGPRMLPYVLIRTGDPQAEAIAGEIMATHLDLTEQAQLEVGVANAALEEGNRPQAARYLHIALGHALSQDPPYESREVLREARRVAALLGDCALSGQIGELERIAAEIRRLRFGDTPDSMAFVPGIGSADPTAALECGAAGEAVRLVMTQEADRQAQINQMFAEYDIANGADYSLTYDMTRSELVLLHDRASSDTKRDRLAEAVHRLMPADAMDFDGPLSDADVRFSRIWAEGAVNSGHRQDAEALLLTVYNALPEDPVERISLLILLLPALPED
ncbi:MULTISPECIES: hypothetical protein [Hyphobacterium]|uniref:Tetratricopeptide repeat protein n=1 Tax=Hyphobacterium vulgare TaxID=1736751 RepID=A0ABV6ZYF1_9PROT